MTSPRASNRTVRTRPDEFSLNPSLARSKSTVTSNDPDACSRVTVAGLPSGPVPGPSATVPGVRTHADRHCAPVTAIAGCAVHGMKYRAASVPPWRDGASSPNFGMTESAAFLIPIARRPGPVPTPCARKHPVFLQVGGALMAREPETLGPGNNHWHRPVHAGDVDSLDSVLEFPVGRNDPVVPPTVSRKSSTTGDAVPGTVFGSRRSPP